MKTNALKEILKNQNVTLRISHFRRLNHDSPIRSTGLHALSSIRDLNLQKFLNCKGGRTVVRLSHGDIKAVAIAECHENDSFCKTSGVLVATKRALDSLNLLNQFPELV